VRKVQRGVMPYVILLYKLSLLCNFMGHMYCTLLSAESFVIIQDWAKLKA